MTEDRGQLAGMIWRVAPDTQPATGPGPELPSAQGMTLASALDAFVKDLKVQRKRPRTISNYRAEIGRFLKWLREERSVTMLDAVTSGELRDYLAGFVERGLRETSQRTTTITLNAWFAWLEREGLITCSPMHNVGIPRPRKHILPAFRRGEIRLLVEACETARDRVMVLALYDCGCRASEFVALNVGDVDLKSGYIAVWDGKGGKDRTTCIGERTMRMLALYLELERPSADMVDPLWISRTTGRRLTDTGLRQVLERIGERAGVKNCHPHTFRRTCALDMHRAGASIATIAKMLGHEDLKVLKWYLDLQDSDVQDTHRQYGPVDHLDL
jgi:site-specific recombinase XerD